MNESRIVSASITEYGNRVQGQEEKLSIVSLFSRDLTKNMTIRDGWSIDQTRKSL